jgi:hypothetical protein
MGTSDTVIVLVPLFVSLVAVMSAVPGATAVTIPVVDTVATDVLLDPHVTTRSVTTLPTLSLTVGVRARVCVTNMLLVGGDTATVPTGIFVTVTVAVPLLPSLVAVIVAVPGATPVTTPADVTVATAALLDVHAMTRSVTTVPFVSLTVGVSVTVAVTRMPGVGGESTTPPTGTGVTVTNVVPDLPSLVAVITTVPGVTPVTRPVGDTVATAGALVAQVTTRSETTLPFTSSTFALNWRVDLATIDAPGGRMLTDPTATLEIVSSADPLFPSLVAVIVALPAATAVTVPCAETVATAVFELDHATAGPVTTLPEASFSVAASCVA